MRSSLPAAAFLIALAAACGPAPAQEGGRRVLVLGIDGADAEVTERLLAEGKLPAFDALRKRGCYGRLATTNPAQSPVSWAAFSTGSNPGKTQVFDFLRRDPGAPGKIGLATAVATSVPGPLGEGMRLAIPIGAGLGAGLVAYALLALLLRFFPALSANRRRAAAAFAGIAAAVLLGFFAHRALSRVPERVPKAVSLRQGVPLWVVLGEAGVPVVALEAPVSFPADRARNLSLLTGLGTPDVQGHWGHYTVLTGDAKEKADLETGGFADALFFDGEGVARSRVYGPVNITFHEAEKRRIGEESVFREEFFKGHQGVPSAGRFQERVAKHAKLSERASCIVEVRRDPAAGTVTVRIGTGGPRPVLELPLPDTGPGPAAALPAPGDPSVRWGEPVVLKERAWSAYVPFDFELDRLLGIRVKGIGKFWLESAGGEGRTFRLLLAPISFDPRDVPEVAEVSWPREFAPSLAARSGLYSLVGWPCLTNPVKDGVLSDEAFVAQVREVLEERRAKFRDVLRRDGWRMLFAMFSEVDRVQHALWRHTDPKSPLHDAGAAKVFAPAVEEFYVAMDGVLGEMLAEARPGDAVIVLSDHGFASFNRGVNLNTWLRAQGYLAGEFGDDRGVNQIFSGRDMFERTDWARTKAYALGLGGIYLNRKGREKEGSVAPEQADAVMSEIRTKLLALRDGDGSRVVRDVYFAKDLYTGPAVSQYAPDMVVGFEKGYRVSWQSTLGGGGAEVIEDNLFPWSGDHCSVDPTLVPGILLSTERLRTEKASVIDVAPTILEILGVPAPPDWDGRSLLEK